MNENQSINNLRDKERREKKENGEEEENRREKSNENHKNINKIVKEVTLNLLFLSSFNQRQLFIRF